MSTYDNETKSYAEFSMVITKASIPNKADRTMRIRMTNSDTGEDSYEERMSVDLFNDFVARIEDNSPVPEPFDKVVSEGNWNGGMPYLSISHYKSGNGENVPGLPEKIYVDGEKLKSSAILNDNPLGLAVWKSVCQDIEERDKPLEERTFENPVRISIGFLDLEHKHELEDEEDYVFTRTSLKQKCEKCEEGINGKVYLKGQLVHLAFTRVPANPRTQVEVLRMGDEIKTKKEDAESIIGDLAEELVGKSSVVEDDAMVVKTSDEKDLENYAYSVRQAFYDKFRPPAPSLWISNVTDKSVVAYEDEKLYRVSYQDNGGEISFDKRSKWEEVQYGLVPVKSEAMEDEWMFKFEKEKSEVTEEEMEETNQVEEATVEEEVVEETTVENEKSAIEKATDDFKAKALELKSKGITGEKAIEVLQPFFNEMGKVVKEEVNPAKPLTADDVAEVMKSTIPEIVSQVLQALPAQDASVQKNEQEVPAPRSIVVNRSTNDANQGRKLTEIQKMALRSTGAQI